MYRVAPERAARHARIVLFNTRWLCKAPDVPLSPPEPPGPEDCCQTGCAECVWTVYQRQLLDYERARARAAGQPEPVDPFAALEAQLYGSSQDKQAPEKQPGDDTQSKAS